MCIEETPKTRRQINSVVRGMVNKLAVQENVKYRYLDSESFWTPSIVLDEDMSKEVAKYLGKDKDGYELVNKLNRYELLVQEVKFLTETLFHVHDKMIPYNKIQEDDPNKDEYLYEISKYISERYYGENE